MNAYPSYEFNSLKWYFRILTHLVVLLNVSTSRIRERWLLRLDISFEISSFSKNTTNYRKTKNRRKNIQAIRHRTEVKKINSVIRKNEVQLIDKEINRLYNSSFSGFLRCVRTSIWIDQGTCRTNTRQDVQGKGYGWRKWCYPKNSKT